MQTRPDTLVLGGGGIAGEAWMTAVLAGLEDASGVQFSACDFFVGTSAGAVVAARLAAGEQLQRPDGGVAGEMAMPPARAAEGIVKTFATVASAVPADLMLRSTERLRTARRRSRLGARRAGAESLGEVSERPEFADLRFDGRLRVVALERASGRRVVFGSPGAPDASVAEAVAASCTVPDLFAPKLINGVEYLDGGDWSTTNIDVAPNARGAHVLCLAPMASLYGGLSRAMRVTARSAAALEAAALRAHGGRVRFVAPDRASATAMGHDFMATGPTADILAAAYAQGLTL